MPATLGIKPFIGLQTLNLARTIWIGFPFHRFENLEIPYPIDPTDRILKKIEYGRIEVDIFQGGVAIERMRILAGLMETLKRKQSVPPHP
jgi:hypothetical protein